MDQGWIKLYRQIRDNPMWNEKPFDKSHAWMDMILSANHQDNRFSIGNQIIDIERGSFITSEVKLSDRWGWSRKKVRCFLEGLEKEQMLSKKSTSKYTTITIDKYSFYQNQGTSEDTSKEHQKNIKRTSKEHQKNTNKNDKECKEGEECKNDKKSLSAFEQTFEDFKSMRKTLKKPMTDRAIELMQEKLDKLSGGDEYIKIKILEQSIENSWQGIFELKGESNGGNRNNNKQDNAESRYDFSRFEYKE